jgi:lipopolysaccharide transport system ATP-binding protein
MNTVIKVENLSKQYRLGSVSTGTISHDINRWWHQIRGKEDPYLQIGETNDRSQKGESDYVWALKDINFEVKHGEVLGIIGRNGAGKSTLLKILSRTTAPTTGSVKIKGRVASLLEVGTGFHPELSGRENIYLNGAILGMTKREIQKKFDEIVDFAGVERYIDTPVKRYSSGMYVRLAFAVAAHLEPEILVVDEVLAVGDADFQKKCLGKMKDVSEKEGRTVLFVSHNMAAVQSLCNRALFLSNGAVVQLGSVHDVLQSYLNTHASHALSIRWEDSNQTASESSHRVAMHRVEIVPEYVADQTSVFTNTPIRIEFEFSSDLSNEFLLVNFQLKTMNEEVVFHIDSNELSADKGRYVAVCHIPPNFLNDGYYRISRIQFISQHSRVERRYEEELSFEVKDFRTKFFWHGKWPGVTRPIDLISFPVSRIYSPA